MHAIIDMYHTITVCTLLYYTITLLCRSKKGWRALGKGRAGWGEARESRDITVPQTERPARAAIPAGRTNNTFRDRPHRAAIPALRSSLFHADSAFRHRRKVRSQCTVDGRLAEGGMGAWRKEGWSPGRRRVGGGAHTYAVARRQWAMMAFTRQLSFRVLWRAF